jgi:hypothetical protein
MSPAGGIMRFATPSLLTLVLLSGSTVARADEATPKPTTDATARPDSPELADAVEYGVDIRFRQVFLPSGLLGVFVDQAAGGASNGGIGVDLVRRRGNVELQLGFEYEHINIKEGVYINKGDDVTKGDTVDYILGPPGDGHGDTNFGWFTLEFTFLSHHAFNKYVALRYGGGAGIGFLTGSIKRWDTMCAAGATNTNNTPQCVPQQLGTGGQGITVQDSTGAPETAPVAYNLPFAFPVINAILGVQIRPTPKAVINIEGGLRTLPFIGMSAGYFF